MGAQEFYTYQPGTDVKEAFSEAVSLAVDQHGNRGYTGTLAEKYEYTVIQAEPVSEDAAMELACRLINDGDVRVDNKWGPAGAIAVAGGPHTRKITIPARPGGYGTFEEAIRAHLGELPPGVTYEREIGGGYEQDSQGRIKGGSATVSLTGGTAHTGWLFFGSAPS